MNQELVLKWLSVGVVVSPALLLGAIGSMSLAGRPLSERSLARSTQFTVLVGLTCALAILAGMLLGDTRRVVVDLGNWVYLPLGENQFRFRFEFLFDRLSVPFVILSYLLIGTIGAFARNYLHRESGFHRFFLYYAIFLLGMILATLAGTIETLFAGWELVGLSSALLVAFFQDRPSPVANGLRVWSVYRLADGAFLVAALTMHHLTGEGEFGRMLGTASWPEGQAALTSQQAFVVGSLLLFAAAGKSALIPFSGWLPRAMEGPTPSSAVFYGALSVHLGAFLLLRTSPILDASPALAWIVVVLGLGTACYGLLAGRVQSDIKTILALASLTQVGLIVAEIGIGLRYVPLVHILGHACFRTLQLLRAPSILREYHRMENLVMREAPRPAPLAIKGVERPDGIGSGKARITYVCHPWLFRLGLERGYLDAGIQEFFVRPLHAVFQACDRLERRWTNWLSGGVSRASEEQLLPWDPVEELG